MFNKFILIVSAALCSPSALGAVETPAGADTCSDVVGDSGAEHACSMQSSLLQRQTVFQPIAPGAGSETPRAEEPPPPNPGPALEKPAEAGSEATQIGGTFATVTLPQPVAWFHVPRTGSSFAYTLLTVEGLCDWHSKPPSGDWPAARMITADCPGLFVSIGCEPESSFDFCAEFGIGGLSYDVVKGNLVGFFRDPKIRLASDWAYSCSQRGGICAGLAEFASEHEGCATQMLSRDGDMEHCASTTLPTQEELEVAKDRVMTGFSFVGLTDQWDLSICLFNAMFNVPCQSSEFSSYSNHSTGSHDLSELDDFVDRFDTELFEVAQEKFQSNLLEYGVSDETCTVCYELMYLPVSFSPTGA